MQDLWDFLVPILGQSQYSMVRGGTGENTFWEMTYFKSLNSPLNTFFYLSNWFHFGNSSMQCLLSCYSSKGPYRLFIIGSPKYVSHMAPYTLYSAPPLIRAHKDSHTVTSLTFFVVFCQHISSRRHKDRVAGKPMKPKYSPYNKQQRSSTVLAVCIFYVPNQSPSRKVDSTSGMNC